MKLLTILMIVTSAGTMGATDKPTGVWFEEMATPYYIMKDAGYDVEIVSIQGGKIPIDPRSLSDEGDNAASVERFLQDSEAMQAIQESIPVEQIQASNYAGVFLPGGHGTMWDFSESEALARIVSQLFIFNRPVAAVCHGPAGLLKAVDAKGQPIVANRKVAAFTNAEEDAVGLTDAVPFLLEDRLRELGAKIEKAPNFQAHAVIDGNLITGQNPASSEKSAELMLELLNAN